MDESSDTLLRTAFGERYGEFRQLAALFVAREEFPECPSPTSLLHQAWLRSKNHRENPPISTESIDRAVLATMMERILVEKARSYRRRREILKQAFVTGSYDVATVTYDDGLSRVPDLVDLERALNQLEKEHPEKAALVRLRYFGGLSLEECAKSLDVSNRTADRYWQFARAWLIRAMEQP